MKGRAALYAARMHIGPGIEAASTTYQGEVGEHCAEESVTMYPIGNLAAPLPYNAGTPITVLHARYGGDGEQLHRATTLALEIRWMAGP